MSDLKYNKLSYSNIKDFTYGKAINPVKLKNGIIIGGGYVLPEINFTLPPMDVNGNTMDAVIKQYGEMIEDICKRAYELHVPAFITEIELVPPTTYNPQWGIDITKKVKEILKKYEDNKGLKSAIRITPVDIREDKLSCHMWKGNHWENIMRTFEGCAMEGADLLSIESIGGKDVHDDAVMYCEIKKSLFALGILGVKDMEVLWGEIAKIAEKTGTIAAGDTACGFANTAMVLADRGYVPKLFSAVVRVMAAVRSLVALEQGALGPHKDCGYEGVYIKAITGTPISMEGKSSACAHLSPLGNIAGALADLWSNESVQNVKLLGGPAPTVSMEQLAYDCRLMNLAADKGETILFRDLLTDSDSKYDPQAYVLRPDIVLRISERIVSKGTHYDAIKEAAMAALEEMQKGLENDELNVEEREISWLDAMKSQIDNLTDDEEIFTQSMVEETRGDKFIPEKYNL